MTKKCTRVIDTKSIVLGHVSGTLSGFNYVVLRRRPYCETGKRNAAFHSNTMITVNSSSTDKTMLVADRGKELANFRVVTANKAYFYEEGLLFLILTLY